MRSVGANTQLQSEINSFVNRSVAVATVDTALTDEKCQGVLLVAGDVIQYLGNNAGNNGAIDYLLAVQEVPA